MDDLRFDRLVWALVTGATRRQTLQRVAGAGLAGLLAQAGIEEAAAACVKLGKKGCKGPRNRKCCPGATCTGGNKDKVGKCVCRGGLKQCGATCVDTASDKNHCGGCNQTCPAGLICTNGTCTSVLGCRAGDQICVDDGNCPGSNNPGCFCITDVEGTPRCSDATLFVCSTCTTNAECGPNKACFPANIGSCGCAGNACAAATCGGVS